MKIKKCFSIESGILKKYSGSIRHVEMPADVRRIGDSAFSGNNVMKTIIIPDSVSEICQFAFAWCSKLESVTIPDSVRTIGNGAFYNCHSLKSVTLSEGLVTIGKSAFEDCDSLEKINFPDSLTRIGSEAFKGCNLLKLNNIPECLPEIGENAFHGADPYIMECFQDTRKRKIAVYSGIVVTVKKLRRHQKSDRLQCTSFHGYHVIVDETCKIGQRMVFFPVGGQLDEKFVKEIHLLRGDEVVNPIGCHLDPEKRKITVMKLHGELSEGLALPIEVLGKYTDIDSLKEGDRIFNLNGHAICGIFLSDEMEIDILHKTLVRYSGNRNSPQKVYVPWGIEEIGSCAFLHSAHITEVFLPETVKRIGEKGFYDCPELRKVVIPGSVTDIGEEAFAHCEKLTADILPPSLKHLEDSVFFAKDFMIENGKLVKYTGDIRETGIPEEVTEIGDDAFYGCHMIEIIRIPEGVIKIGNNAFEDCRKLRKISIPDSVRYIGHKAFFKCKALHEITIPSNVEFIGKHAFGVYYFHKYIDGFKFPYEEYRRYQNFHIYCKKGSVAENYALENGLTYSCY